MHRHSLDPAAAILGLSRHTEFLRARLRGLGVAESNLEDAIGEFPEATREQVREACVVARRAFAEWGRTPAPIRGQIIGSETGNLWDPTVGANLNCFRVAAHQEREHGPEAALHLPRRDRVVGVRGQPWVQDPLDRGADPLRRFRANNFLGGAAHCLFRCQTTQAGIVHVGVQTAMR